MKTMPEIVLATRRGSAAKPRLPKDWNVRNVTLKSLLKRHDMADITIVDMKTPEALSDSPELTRVLAERFEESPESNFVVLCFDCHEEMPLREKVELLKPFSHPERIEISENINTLTHLVKNLMVKLLVLKERKSGGKFPVPSPLDRVKGIVSASSDLRVENGNLSAEAIAKLYGISLNQLATWLGRTRQALNKTPDADSLQDELSYFERIARLRTALSNNVEFRKWLRMPHAELNGETPLRWIERKRWQALSDLVDDMLTGAPA
jgi:hypothetical protein